MINIGIPPFFNSNIIKHLAKFKSLKLLYDLGPTLLQTRKIVPFTLFVSTALIIVNVLPRGNTFV